MCNAVLFSRTVKVSLPRSRADVVDATAAEADGVARPRREAAAVEVGDALAVGAGEAEAAGLVAGVAVIEGEPVIAGEAAAVAPGEA